MATTTERTTPCEKVGSDGVSVEVDVLDAEKESLECDGTLISSSDDADQTQPYASTLTSASSDSRTSRQLTRATTTVQVGAGAVAGGPGSVAVGYAATTGNSAQSSVALGDQTVTDGSGGVSIGRSAYTSHKNGIAIGGGMAVSGSLPRMGGVQSLADNAIALGANTDGGARATALSSMALGARAEATGSQSIAIGAAIDKLFNDDTLQTPTTASGVGAIAMGSNTVAGAQATEDGAIALGGSLVQPGPKPSLLGREARQALMAR
ncbi:hypothetical protein KUW18_02695 [Halomonas sp. DP5Y7-2]|uniref:hypothetical protein n=1 Tax=Halomonas sp. DP5Y7-2 TaxID=2859076 RepID=UPI001C9A0720|nr:hypothetical protein [Halomonas sp. DP5Y7-2]MBY5982992.1 hypothetical protein [Halomonas sp. DP5Y7-2]